MNDTWRRLCEADPITTDEIKCWGDDHPTPMFGDIRVGQVDPLPRRPQRCVPLALVVGVVSSIAIVVLGLVNADRIVNVTTEPAAEPPATTMPLAVEPLVVDPTEARKPGDELQDRITAYPNVLLGSSAYPQLVPGTSDQWQPHRGPLPVGVAVGQMDNAHRALEGVDPATYLLNECPFAAPRLTKFKEDLPNRLGDRGFNFSIGFDATVCKLNLATGYEVGTIDEQMAGQLQDELGPMVYITQVSDMRRY